MNTIALALATIVATASVIVSFPPYDVVLCFFSGCVMGYTGSRLVLLEMHYGRT